MIAIIDHGMGNLLSVYHALEMVGGIPQICAKPEDLNQYERLILPGVGAFGDCMANLHKKGFVDALDDMVIKQGKPILGICLGMQIMAGKGFEGGEHIGLGWFDADVIRICPHDPSLRVPQVGWNDISYDTDCPLFQKLPQAPDVYFVHSYFMQCKKENDVKSHCDYGGALTAAVCKDNIIATQFHPEKSQDYGLQMLENFLDWMP